MCCFSVARPLGFFGRLFAPKVHVSSTNIFARMFAPGMQGLAYSMSLETKKAVAMVLPLPVRAGSGEDALRFIDLKEHPQMFVELDRLFFSPQALGEPKGGPWRHGGATLAVHRVGSFIASYVPSVADFVRLDPRFRLPEVLFEAVPTYRDYGFAVFQLEAGSTRVHPMAFAFPTRDASLFFPTVHLHDGRWHDTAEFDHALYYQGSFPSDEQASSAPQKDYAGLVDVAQPLRRRKLHGTMPNADIWIEA